MDAPVAEAIPELVAAPADEDVLDPAVVGSRTITLAGVALPV